MNNLDKKTIPAATVPRLSHYLRKLQEVQGRGIETISSRQLADEVGTNPAQIRKDLSYFGEFGIRGVGYQVDRLIEELERCLGLHRTWNVIIVGSGKLGTALALYRGFEKQGFKLVAMFDSDRRVIGKDRGAGPVKPVADLEKFLRRNEVNIAIVTTPAEPAHELIDRLAAAGVPSILNFAPVKVPADGKTIVHQVDLSTELMTLAFYLDS